MPGGQNYFAELIPGGNAPAAGGAVATPVTQGPLAGQIYVGKPDRVDIPPNYEPDPDRPGAVRPIRGGPADVSGGDVEASDLTGDEYIKTLDAPTAAMVKALSEGRKAFPAGAALRAPYWQNMLAHVANYDPGFDEANYTSRVSTRRDFNVGTAGKNIRALNTAIGHLGQLYSQIGGTWSGMSPRLNAVANTLTTEVGGAGPTTYESTASALAGELTAVYRGSGGAEADIQRYIKELTPDASEEQKRATIKNISGLLNSRLEALQDQYRAGMGLGGRDDTFLSPEAQKTLDAINSGKELEEPKPTQGEAGKDDNFATPGYTWKDDNGDTWVVARDEQGTVTHVNTSTGEKSLYLGGLQENEPKLSAEEQAKVDAAVQEGSGKVAGAMDSWTFGGLNKLGAAASAIPEALAGEGSVGDRYAANKRMNDAVIAGLQQKDPYGYLAGQLGGGLLMPMGEVRSVGQAMRYGGGMGAAYGLGGSESLRDIPANVLTGAATGAATGYLGQRGLEALNTRAANRAATRAAASPLDGATGGLPPPKLSAAERYDRGQRHGLDLSIGDVTGMSGKAVERILDVQPGAATVMNEAREGLGQQVTSAVDKVAGTYGRTTDFRGVGQAVQKGAKGWIDRFQRRAGQAYDAIPIPGRFKATLDNTRGALQEITSQFSSNPKLAAALKNSKLNEYLAALTPEVQQLEHTGEMAGVKRTLGLKPGELEVGGGLSWEDLKKFRTRIGEEIGEARFSDSPMKSELRQLYAALSKDMEATAGARGEKALRAWQKANDFYRKGQTRIDDSLTQLLGDDSKMTVEETAKRVQEIIKSGKGSSDENLVHDLWKSLPNTERGEVANGLVRLMGQPRNSEGRVFNPQTFMQNYADMTPNMKNLIFGAGDKELRTNLDDFAGAIGDIAANRGTRNVSNTGMTLAGMGGLWAGGVLGLIAQTAGTYGAAKFMTSPKMVRWMIGYEKMLNGAAKAGATPTKANLMTHLRLLDKVIAVEPSIAAEASGLRDKLASGITDTVAPQEREPATAAAR